MNKYLLLFDIFLLPITLIRMLLIYIWGSKYDIPHMSFLDIMFHADKPYFNQEGEMVVNTISNDIRCVIHDNSRLTKVINTNSEHIVDKKEIKNIEKLEVENVNHGDCIFEDKKVSEVNDQVKSNELIEERMGVDVFGKMDEYILPDNMMTEIESDTDDKLNTDAEESPKSPSTDSEDMKRATNETKKLSSSLLDLDSMVNKVWDDLDFESD